jgi:hypothetical protein
MEKEYLKIIADGMIADKEKLDILVRAGIDLTDCLIGLQMAVDGILTRELTEIEYDDFMNYVYGDGDWVI